MHQEGKEITPCQSISTRGDQKVRGKVLLNHNAITDCNENSQIYTWKKVREHLLCYACILWTKIFLRSGNVLTKLFSKSKPVVSKVTSP